VSEITPTINQYVPLPRQFEVIRDIRRNYDYSIGTHEVLLSGAVGSAKSLLLAHIMVTHCLLYPGAVVGVGRRVHKDLRDTLIEVTRQHCGEIVPADFHGVTGTFRFSNGSIIRPFSWADRHYKKFRSHEFSMFVIEELTENSDQEFYTEIVARVGRLRHIKEKLVICATNPDDPEHWAYRHFFLSKSKRRHVYLSKTSDNPYLPSSYIEQLRENMDPREARRMIEGEWLPIRTEVVYHQYDSALNYKPETFPVNPKHPIRWAWDFNIGDGKPLSTCFFQHIDGHFHVFHDLAIQGLRTEDMLEEAHGRGLLDHDAEYVIHGDATGKHKDTRSRHSDYEIIRKWLANTKTRGDKTIRFRLEVPLANPKVRYRHNVVNGQLCSASGKRSLTVYREAPTVHEGLMLTKLKAGADYIEDDGPRCPYQHVTTALGYGIIATLNENNKSQITVIRR
jgi:hypothetical protein